MLYDNSVPRVVQDMQEIINQWSMASGQNLKEYLSPNAMV